MAGGLPDFWTISSFQTEPLPLVMKWNETHHPQNRLLEPKDAYTWNFRLCEIIARSWNNTFFCCLGYFLLFSKNNAVSCLGFWLLGNGCQPVLFLSFLDGKLRRFKCLSAPWWEVQCPKTSQNQKTLGGRKKMQVPQKSNNFWKSKNWASFGRSRYTWKNEQLTFTNHPFLDSCWLFFFVWFESWWIFFAFS